MNDTFRTADNAPLTTPHPKGIVYIANPYTHPCRHVVEERVQKVTDFAAALLAEGVVVYSPIVHGHALATQGATRVPTGWDFWREVDLPFLDAASAVYVLTLPGWLESPGVTEEIAYARSKGLLVRYWEASVATSDIAGVWTTVYYDETAVEVEA